MSDPGTSTPASQSGHPGQWEPPYSNNDFNAITFLVKQFAALMHIATIVQIKAVNNADEVSPVGFVDVQSMVNLIDGQGTSSPRGTIFNVPYIRIQGGKNAIICDPEVNDLGLCVFSDRDISSVKANKGIANPGSRRRNDPADGIYVGGLLNVTPEQYIRFYPGGIDLVDKNGNTIHMNTDGVIINGVKFDRSQNVSNVANFTSIGMASLAGGSKKVVLDGDAVVSGHVVASSSATKAT